MSEVELGLQANAFYLRIPCANKMYSIGYIYVMYIRDETVVYTI